MSTSTHRSRPSILWFFVGGGLILLGVLAFGVLLVLTLSRATMTDDVVVVPAAGEPFAADVEPDAKRMLFMVRGEPPPQCAMTDGSGQTVPIEPVATDVIVGGGTEWQGFGTFTARTSQVELTCSRVVGGQQLRVGAPLDIKFVGGILVTIFVPLLLVGTGILVLIVTLIRWFSGPPVVA